MISKNVWIIPDNVNQLNQKKIIPSMMLVNEKVDEMGNIKIKARLVAGGNHQHCLYQNNSSPTVSIISIFLNILLAVRERKVIEIIDVAGAYLNAKLNDEVYMTLNREFSRLIISKHPEYQRALNNEGRIVVKLVKALYGLKQSAKLWYLEIKKNFTRKL